MLGLFQKVYLGDLTNAKNANLPDLQPREWASVVPLCAMAIVMGVFPTLFLRPMEPSVRKVVERVQAVRPVRVALPREAGPDTVTGGAAIAQVVAEPR
jgi:NADH-quinone oxidoreductase subunit M